MSQTNSFPCPAPDALHRLAHGFSSAAERAELDEHLIGCSDCRRDLESLETAVCDLILAAADRRELRDFRPGPTHAALCEKLDDRQLQELTRSGATPPRDVRAHLETCPYCRQRFFLQLHSSQHPTLAARLVGSLIDAELSGAALAVDRALRAGRDLPWQAVGPALHLVERIKVWLDAQGQMVSGGLFAMLPGPQVAIAMGPAIAEKIWEVPLSGQRISIALRVRPAAGQWQLEWQAAGDEDSTRQATYFLEDPARPTAMPRASGPLPVAPAMLKIPGGVWQLHIRLDAQSWIIPLEFGQSPGPT